MRMFFLRQNFGWASALSLGAFASHKATVVEEEAKQVKILRAELLSQEEVVSQPAIEILDNRTGSHGCPDQVGDRLFDEMEAVAQVLAKPFFLLPVARIGLRDGLSFKELSNP